MTLVLFYLLLGVGLLLLVVYSLFSARAAEGLGGESLNVEETVARFAAEVGFAELAERLFGPEDWNFVLEQRSERAKRIFLRQRTALALGWIDAMRVLATGLMRRHRLAARSNAQLDPTVEFRLACEYFGFQFLCGSVALAVRLHGPVGLSGVVRRFGGLFERLSQGIRELSTREMGEGEPAASYTFKL